MENSTVHSAARLTTIVEKLEGLLKTVSKAENLIVKHYHKKTNERLAQLIDFDQIQEIGDKVTQHWSSVWSDDPKNHSDTVHLEANAVYKITERLARILWYAPNYGIDHTSEYWHET